MKLKKSSIESVAASGEQKAGGAFISARHRNPEEEMALSARKPDIVGGVCAILATIVLVLTIVSLYMTWDFIRSA